MVLWQVYNITKKIKRENDLAGNQLTTSNTKQVFECTIYVILKNISSTLLNSVAYLFMRGGG